MSTIERRKENKLTAFQALIFKPMHGSWLTLIQSDKGRPDKIFIVSMVANPAITALVVAMAGIILPAMAT